MREISARFYLDVAKNSYGKEDKKKVIWALYTSSFLFLLLSIILLYNASSKWFILLFAGEGIGQLALALENHKTFKAQNYLVKYFNDNLLGIITGAIFSSVIIARIFLIQSVFDNYGLFYLISLSLLVLYFVGIFIFKKRRDIFCGLSIFLVSLFLSFVLIFFGNGAFDFWIGLNQLLYSFLLILGVLFLRPWIAELLNIILWVSLFIILFY